MRHFTTAALILLLMSGVSPAKPVEQWKVERLDRIKVDYRKVPRATGSSRCAATNASGC